MFYALNFMVHDAPGRRFYKLIEFGMQNCNQSDYKCTRKNQFQFYNEFNILMKAIKKLLKSR